MHVRAPLRVDDRRGGPCPEHERERGQGRSHRSVRRGGLRIRRPTDRGLTDPAVAHHEPDTPAQEGVGIAIAHEGQQYGVLTVHVPPGVDATATEIELLETIGTDFGYFIHAHLLEVERESLAEIIERIDEMKSRVLRTESPITYQLTLTFPGGRERTYIDDSLPALGLDGTMAICQDVTDLETREPHVRVLGRVLRHNVNNMNVVLGYAETIHERTDGVISRYADNIL